MKDFYLTIIQNYWLILSPDVFGAALRQTHFTISVYNCAGLSLSVLKRREAGESQLYQPVTN